MADHITLETGERRVILVGDVHGCIIELKALLAGIVPPYNSEEDVLILVGDLVGKGPESGAVVKFARECKNCHAVKGNWDVKGLEKYQSKSKKKHASTPLKDKYTFVEQLTEEDVRYLSALPYTITLPDLDAVVVHAGFIPGVPLHRQEKEHMTDLRTLQGGADGVPFTGSADGKAGVLWGSMWTGPLHVYFGHHASAGLQIHPHATGLDTNCCRGGSLTAIVLPARKLFEVTSVVTDPTLKVRVLSVEGVNGEESRSVYRDSCNIV